MAHTEPSNTERPCDQTGGFEAASKRRVRAKVDEGGRIVIPAEFRRVLGWQPGEAVLLLLGEGDVQIMSVAESIRQVQDWVRAVVPVDRSLSEELIAERRTEAAHE